MTKPTRLFVLVSGGILVAGLGTGLVAAYVGGFQNLSILGNSGPDELSYLPASSKVVAFANVREIMDSELHQKLKDLAPRNDSGMARFEEETGVDVTRDVDYVLAAIGGEASGTTPGEPLIVARGRFDTVRIEGLVRSKGGTVQDYRGVRLLSVVETNGGTNNMRGALAFVEPGLIAMGADTAVRRAIDAQKGDVPNASSNADIVRLVKTAGEGNAWVVAKFDALSAGGQVPPEVLQKLPAINWLTLTGHVNGGLRAVVSAEARDDAAAKNLRDVLQGFMAMAKLHAGQKPELAPVMQSLTVSGTGNTVALSFEVPPALIDALIELKNAN